MSTSYYERAKSKKSNTSTSGLSYIKRKDVGLDYNLEKIVTYVKLFARIL